jgi:hypothetical protein
VKSSRCECLPWGTGCPLTFSPPPRPSFRCVGHALNYAIHANLVETGKMQRRLMRRTSDAAISAAVSSLADVVTTMKEGTLAATPRGTEAGATQVHAVSDSSGPADTTTGQQQDRVGGSATAAASPSFSGVRRRSQIVPYPPAASPSPSALPGAPDAMFTGVDVAEETAATSRSLPSRSEADPAVLPRGHGSSGSMSLVFEAPTGGSGSGPSTSNHVQRAMYGLRPPPTVFAAGISAPDYSLYRDTGYPGTQCPIPGSCKPLYCCPWPVSACARSFDRLTQARKIDIVLTLLACASYAAGCAIIFGLPVPLASFASPDITAPPR